MSGADSSLQNREQKVSNLRADARGSELAEFATFYVASMGLQSWKELIMLTMYDNLYWLKKNWSSDYYIKILNNVIITQCIVVYLE